ncbi:hypothetical protein GJ744_008972 [Endocarpon pusillum]|uniref:Uncharacterized protein n=1 Tax=Endocarpon pusillum TaxID=364733 RepID=A0A8H7AGI1_9EURO|nr:hypothetical protein GJ744_008972 [Endocarpon pusillum]
MPPDSLVAAVAGASMVLDLERGIFRSKIEKDPPESTPALAIDISPDGSCMVHEADGVDTRQRSYFYSKTVKGAPWFRREIADSTLRIVLWESSSGIPRPKPTKRDLPAGNFMPPQTVSKPSPAEKPPSQKSTTEGPETTLESSAAGKEPEKAPEDKELLITTKTSPTCNVSPESPSISLIEPKICEPLAESPALGPSKGIAHRDSEPIIPKFESPVQTINDDGEMIARNKQASTSNDDGETNPTKEQALTSNDDGETTQKNERAWTSSDYGETVPRTRQASISVDYGERDPLWDKRARQLKCSCPESFVQSALDIWDLLYLWERPNIGNNLLIDTGIYESMCAPGTFRRFSDQFDTLHHSKNGANFLMFRSVVEVETYSNNRIRVDCTFPSVSPIKPYTRIIDFPLQFHLGGLLLSQSCASSLYDGNVVLGCKLVTLDLLRANIESWADFLENVRREGMDADHIPYIHDVQYDRRHVSQFARIVRDIGEALEFTISAIEREITYTTSKGNPRDFDKPIKRESRLLAIQLESRTKMRVIKHLIEDIQSNADRQMDLLSSNTNQVQSASLKRLTLVASIFLPLSLGSSLLSMTTRAANLGPLWYDYFGICITIGFIVLTTYRIFRFNQRVWSHPKMIRCLRHVRDEWRDTRKKNPSSTTPVLIFNLVSKTTHYMLYVFCAVMTASFLVGMFKNIETGLRTLAYGLPATVFYTVLLLCTLVAWKFRDPLTFINMGLSFWLFIRSFRLKVALDILRGKSRSATV